MPKTEAAAPAEEAPAAKTAQQLQEGQVSIITEGKETVFDPDARELPGMPDICRLRDLAGAFVREQGLEEEHKGRKDVVKGEVMMELRKEGRTSFAYRTSGRIFFFEITASEEKLEVKKK